MKIGLVFAGQGAQYTGMGKDLYEHSNEAKKVMDLAGDQVKEWCFEGTSEMLKQTHITQPCIYTVTMAAYEALFEEIQRQDKGLLEGLEIVGVAGFSLGEYAALTAAGTITDIRTGIEIVTNRGTWMNEAGLDENGIQQGSMTAAFGDRQAILDCVEAVRGDGILQGVNFNSPVQTVVAGDKATLEIFKTEAKVRKIKAIPLSVGTAFHSAMMKPAAEKLREYLMGITLKAPTLKVYSDITAEDIMMEAAAELDETEISRFIADIMGKQAMSPVYWQEIIQNMIAEGMQCLIEIGPGTTLCGIAKKIDGELMTLNVQDMESLQKTVRTLMEHK